MDKDKDKLLTLKDVADRLQVDRETVRNYCISGKLKARKLAGWMWRIKEEDLEVFIEENSNARVK